MTVVNALAYIQKLLVELHSFLILFYVIIKHSDRVIGPSLVSYFSCSPTAKSQHLVIF